MAAGRKSTRYRDPPVRQRCGVRMAALAALASMMFLALPVSANVTVSPIASVIASDQPQVSVIRVTSQSPSTQYVDVSVRRLVDPATDTEDEVPVSIADGDGLIASPAKFVLAGGATRLVRVVALARPEQESVYRVYFRPTTASEDAPMSDTPDAFVPDLQVSFVWGALVRVAPKHPRFGLARTDDNVSLKNTGNVRIQVNAVAHCTGATDDTCEWQDIGRSVYPGMVLAMPETMHALSARVRYRVDGAKGIQVVDLPLAPSTGSPGR